MQGRVEHDEDADTLAIARYDYAHFLGRDMNQPMFLRRFYANAGDVYLGIRIERTTIFEYVAWLTFDSEGLLLAFARNLLGASRWACGRAVMTRAAKIYIDRLDQSKPREKSSYGCYAAITMVHYLIDCDASLPTAPYYGVWYASFVARIQARNETRAVIARVLASAKYRRLRPGMADVMREIVKHIKLP